VRDISALLWHLYFWNKITRPLFSIFLCGASPVLPIADNINLEIINGDILDKERLANVMTGKDAIVHLAAIVGYLTCDNDPECALITNIEGTNNITNLKTENSSLRQHRILLWRCKRIVH
jgi:nucleoside-diphosphate-sugar epimerase